MTQSRAIAAGFLMLALAGCAGRPSGNLVVVLAPQPPGASTVDMLVATTRAEVAEPAGVMFGGERGRGLAFADIAVSIPPDAVRKIGDVQWPSHPPGDPAHDFVTVRADELDLKQAVDAFDDRLRRLKPADRHVLVFVHGYNTRFEEAVYKFAQIAHDAGAPVVPVLFTWPSRGQLFDYVYDRESATYSRDGLETLLQAMAKDPNVTGISVLAHSMGNFVTVEALRQMTIRNRGLSPKIKDIMLASPDIDFDVFRRQIAEIEASDKSPPVTVFVSDDDKALAASSIVAGNEPRLGEIDPHAEPYRSNSRTGACERDRSHLDQVGRRDRPWKVRAKRGRDGYRPPPVRGSDAQRRQGDARRTHRRRRARGRRHVRQGGDARRFRAGRPHRSEYSRDPGRPGGLAREVGEGDDRFARRRLDVREGLQGAGDVRRERGRRDVGLERTNRLQAGGACGGEVIADDLGEGRGLDGQGALRHHAARSTPNSGVLSGRPSFAE